MIGLNLGRGQWLAWCLIAGTVYACEGDVNKSRTSGESHFLDYCEETCGDGLDCISGVCTRGCLLGSATCDDLSAQAACTDQSIEPGDVAVCDVECKSDGDCSELGAAHRCEEGYCRGAAAPAGTGGMGSTGTGGSGGGPSGGSPAVGGAPGAVCYPAHELFDGWTKAETCRTCACSDDGEVDCTDIACDEGIPIYPCPPAEAPLLPVFQIRVDHYSIDGDILTLDVTHGGGCEERYTGLCFGGFLEPVPVRASLRLETRISRDSICAAAFQRTLKFDLSALREAYFDAYGGDSGVIDTDFGQYGFGDLDCEERVGLSNARIASVIEQLDNSCETDDDCMIVSTDTACYSSCGASIAETAQTEFESALETIDENVCTPYTEAGCPAPVPLPCIPGMATCQDGVCR